MRIVTTLITILAVTTPALAHDNRRDGAIHALTGRHHRHHHVTIPRYVHRTRHVGILLPPGTTRPGASRTFIPAREDR